jgi:hypothetical protein
MTFCAELSGTAQTDPDDAVEYHTDNPISKMLTSEQSGELRRSSHDLLDLSCVSK